MELEEVPEVVEEEPPARPPAAGQPRSPGRFPARPSARSPAAQEPAPAGPPSPQSQPAQAPTAAALGAVPPAPPAAAGLPSEVEEAADGDKLLSEPEVRGFPGIGPITDSEPEPEIDTSDEERPEAELEPLDEPPAPAPQAGTDGPAGGKETPQRSGEDVRRELRDYLDGVREKLGPDGTAAGGATPSSPRDLLDYLGKLSDYLPEREKKRFQGSNERLAMESLKAQLAGKPGLRRKVAEAFPSVAPRRKAPMTRSLVVDTFAYLKDLAAWHPDTTVGAAMKERIDSIVARMGRSEQAGTRAGKG